MTAAAILTFTDNRFHPTIAALIGPGLKLGAMIWGGAVLLGFLLGLLIGHPFSGAFALMLFGWMPALIAALVAIVRRTYESVPFAVSYTETASGLEVTANGERMALLRRGQPYRVETRLTPDEYLPGSGQSQAKGITFSRDIFTLDGGQTVLLSRSRLGPDEAMQRLHQIQAAIDQYCGGSVAPVVKSAPAAESVSPSPEGERGFSL